MVAMERFLGLNLMGIRKSVWFSVLDAPVLSALFGEAVAAVATRLWEVKCYRQAFVRYLPCCAEASGPLTIQVLTRFGFSLARGPKESVASRAFPT